MSRRARRYFSKEDKADAVALVRRSGLSLAQVARDLDIGDCSLRQWVKQAEIDEGRGPDGELTTTEREELRQLRRKVRALEQEREFLKKSGDLLRQGDIGAYEVMLAEQARYTVSVMSRALEVSRSGFYAWRKHKGTGKRAREEEILTDEIQKAHKASGGTYGSPRIHADLRAAGHAVSLKRVARIMRDGGLAGCPKRRFVRTTDSNHAEPVAPNLVNRDFKPDAPDKKFLSGRGQVLGFSVESPGELPGSGLHYGPFFGIDGCGIPGRRDDVDTSGMPRLRSGRIT